MVNLRARRGSERIARACQAEIPSAQVHMSRSMGDLQRFTAALGDAPPELIVSAGGDGTALALINTWRASAGTVELPGAAALGLLPLGTGNGWANAVGAPSWRKALATLGDLVRRPASALPRRRFDLVEVEGLVGPFAGTGWDAELIDDFNAQKTGPGILPARYRKGLAGYLQGLFLRTIPRNLSRRALAEVEITNTGEDALTVDEAGRVVPLPGGEHGKVLYRGPASVCGAGTASEWGFGFRAFPFAGVMPRRLHLRIYSGTAAEATLRMSALWRGEHPLPKMHNWLVTSCHAVFSRPVPFQVGGDRLGMREAVDYGLAGGHVDLLDWTALRAH
ncbi:diacylglycerol kinase [Chondromyces crocatus]|uniref:Diacylglycerol kinase n=2 Tax=Chondromyces crocatus TaxID=52 RepID=A0A0K1EQG6_CHOCO|nr:diacylglycerol kinase [Chondromyces crocatus]